MAPSKIACLPASLPACAPGSFALHYVAWRLLPPLPPLPACLPSSLSKSQEAVAALDVSCCPLLLLYFFLLTTPMTLPLRPVVLVC